jgi:hypothetical protein
LAFSQSAITFDAIDAIGYPVGDFMVALAPTILPALAAIVVTWLRVRSGRKVRVKISNTYMEARTPDEIEQLLKAAAEFERDKHSKKHDTP